MSDMNMEPNQKPNAGSVETLSLIGFIFGIVSLLINFWGIVGMAGLIFSILGLNKKVEGKSKTFAIIGCVTGAISILYAFATMV